MVKVKQSLETEVAEMTERLDEESTMNEKLTANKKKLEKQNEELSQDLESAEGNIKRLEKEKGVSKLYKLFVKYKHGTENSTICRTLSQRYVVFLLIWTLVMVALQLYKKKRSIWSKSNSKLLKICRQWKTNQTILVNSRSSLNPKSKM